MVTVYSSPTCGYCHMVKEYLKSKKVAYKELDITKDEAALRWVFDNVGQLATPVVDIEGSVILGFDREQIDLALRDKKLI
jgi:glutaredoxin 3